MNTKNYEDLRFTDDFMFCKIMTTHLDICKEVLEMILNIKIKEVRLTETQKSIEVTADGKGVRLDVYVDDDENTVYDIEMQTTYQPDIAKRSRYYQGMIDLNLLERGAVYERLSKCYVIFICLEKPFKDDTNDLPIYTFKNICVENKDIVLNDDTVKVFLNVASKSQDIPGKIKEFIDYLKGNAPTNDLCKKIDESVHDAISHVKWRAEYMQMFLRDREKFAEGKAEGLAEGKAEGLAKGKTEARLQMIADFLTSGGSEEDAIRMLKATDEELAAAKML